MSFKSYVQEEGQEKVSDFKARIAAMMRNRETEGGTIPRKPSMPALTRKPGDSGYGYPHGAKIEDQPWNQKVKIVKVPDPEFPTREIWDVFRGELNIGRLVSVSNRFAGKGYGVPGTDKPLGKTPEEAALKLYKHSLYQKKPLVESYSSQDTPITKLREVLTKFWKGKEITLYVRVRGDNGAAFLEVKPKYTLMADREKIELKGSEDFTIFYNEVTSFYIKGVRTDVEFYATLENIRYIFHITKQGKV